MDFNVTKMNRSCVKYLYNDEYICSLHNYLNVNEKLGMLGIKLNIPMCLCLLVFRLNKLWSGQYILLYHYILSCISVELKQKFNNFPLYVTKNKITRKISHLNKTGIIVFE